MVSKVIVSKAILGKVGMAVHYQVSVAIVIVSAQHALLLTYFPIKYSLTILLVAPSQYALLGVKALSLTRAVGASRIRGGAWLGLGLLVLGLGLGFGLGLGRGKGCG